MRIKLSLLIILIAASAVYGFDTFLEQFIAKSDGNVINVEWKTLNEDNMKRFELERSSNKLTYQKINDQSAKGVSSIYKYVDSDAMIKAEPNSDEATLAKSVYYYRLRIINKDNSSYYSNTINVTHDVSTIKRTWGMIKEMFR